MPKLKNKPPKYAKLKNYAVVYISGKIHYLGQYGSTESRSAYARLVAEYQPNAQFLLPKPDEGGVTVGELAAAFLDHAEATLKKPNYVHHRIAIGDFLLKLYGDVFVNDFKPSSLKLLREEMIKSQRLCRKQINDYISRVVRVFSWGLEEELVKYETVAVLKAVKPLQEGYPGTHDHEDREEVTDEVIKRTLPFMPPTLRAMVQIQRLTGCRPSEIFNMKAGQIDKNSTPDLWLYRLPQHKTKKRPSVRKSSLLASRSKCCCPRI